MWYFVETLISNGVSPGLCSGATVIPLNVEECDIKNKCVVFNYSTFVCRLRIWNHIF